MEPRRRRWWTLALTLEMLVVCAATGWWLSTVGDDDGPVWVCAALVWVWFAAFMACIAERPAAARRFGMLSLVPLGLAPFVLAYITTR